MIKDRLQELKAILNENYNAGHGPVVVFLDESAQDINSFLNEVQTIHVSIDDIKTNTSEIRRLYSIMLTLPRGHEQTNTEVADRTESIQKTMRVVQNNLKNLETMEHSYNSSSKTLLHRIQSIQIMTLSRLFAEAIQEYNFTLQNHKERCTAIAKRQLKISSRNDEELNELLLNDSAVFVDNIIAETLEAQLKLKDINSRHVELLKIEASLREMRNMFNELAILVDMQGENMNCIRYFVEHAEGHTVHGKTKLEKAKRKAKKRKRRCRKVKIVLAILVVILLLIILAQIA